MYRLQTILLYISIYHNKKILVYINYKHINLKKNYKIKEKNNKEEEESRHQKMGKYNIFQYTYYEYISYEFTKANKI